jgi:hypothetical protein
MTCDRIASLGTGCVIVALLSGCGDGGASLVGYQKSGGEWVYVTWDAGHGRVEHHIKGADTSTFEVLSADNYARDKEHVYFKMLRLDKSDPSTFVVVSDLVYVYGKDRNRVWLRDVVVRDVDPATFETLTFPYARDRSHVFCGTLPMKVHDVDSFEVLQGTSSLDTSFAKGKPFKEQYKDLEVTQDNPISWGHGWARDDRACYFGPFELKNADHNSFTALNDIYAKDKDRVYWCWMQIPLADAKTFKVRKAGGGMDKDRTFLGPEPRVMPRNN